MSNTTIKTTTKVELHKCRDTSRAKDFFRLDIKEDGKLLIEVELQESDIGDFIYGREVKGKTKILIKEGEY